MSCYHPLVGFPTGKLTKNGKTEYKIEKTVAYSSLEKVLELNPNAILIPCGKCIGCRLDYSRHWADRMMLELEEQGKAIFLTITYDEVHIRPTSYVETVPIENMYYPLKPWQIWTENQTLLVPEYYTLNKRDCQLFMKRLRQAFPHLRIRFYLAGEYGDKTLRPHYHAIVYGLSVDDFWTCDHGCMCHECSLYESKYKGHCDKFMVKVVVGKNEMGDVYYTSPLLRRIWSNGNVLFSEVSWKTCAYVARYVTKKVGGELEQSYQIRNCEKEFSLMSRRPGIGRSYFDKHPECIDQANICISTSDGAKKIEIPSYFLRVAELTDKEKVDTIKERRKKASMESMKIQLKSTSLQQLEYLETKEQIKENSVKALGRKSI